MPKYYPVINLEGEKWLPILGFENLYEISNKGRVKVLTQQRGVMPNGTPRIFKERIYYGSIDSDGYFRIGLYDKVNKKHHKRINRLVAIAFVPNPENKPEVNHLAGDKSNNNDWNLRWDTSAENNLHAKKLGLNKGIGETSNFAKLKQFQAEEILYSKKPTKELAIKFNVHKHTIRLIRSRKNWKQLTDKSYST